MEKSTKRSFKQKDSRFSKETAKYQNLKHGGNNKKKATYL